MAPRILLSVAVVTRNRPRSLERALASLRDQEEQPFEIVVSDDSDMELVLGTTAIAHKFGCRYVRGPRRGLYANRNSAALQCRGTHIRTMDDDHILSPDHLSKCMAALQREQSAIWTTGEHGFIEERSVGIADGSTIYPREVFDRGFRIFEEFGFGSSYLEFGAYLYRQGWKCRCIPGAVVEHHSTGLSCPDPLSLRFASICYNRYFRPSTLRLIRCLAPHWECWTKLASLFEIARRRWNAS